MPYFLQLMLALLVASSALWSSSAAALDVPAGAFAQGAFDNGEARVETRLIVDREEVELGEEIRVGVLFELEPEWHVYGEEPGDAGLPTSILWYSEGADVQITSWPATEEFIDPSGRIRTNGYSERVVFESDATVVQTDGALELSVDVDYLACKIQCLPGTAKLRRSVPIGTSKPASEQVLALFDNFGRDRIAPIAGAPEGTSAKATALSAPAHAKVDVAVAAAAPATPVPLWQALLLALLGGVLLNLMPCVFPVLALKVFGFVSTAAHRPTALKHSAAYAGGIVGSMMILATVVVAVKLGGDAVGWGFQFQSPAYLVALTLFMVVFALNLFGVFDVQSLPLPSNAGEASLGRSFVDGTLAVVLATPCSAPFLGTAVGFALASGPAVIYATFIAVGLGLAAPFMVACTIPGIGKRLPRPGAWMEQLERFLGFVLLGTAIWLLWVFGQSAGVNGITALLVCALLVSLGGWIYGRLQYRGSASKWLGLSAAVALLILPAARLQPWAIGAPAAQVVEVGRFIPWDPAQIRAEQAAGRVVFVDFTADWCITCKVNEHAALSSDEIWAFFAKNDVVVMKADWTTKSEPIRLALAEHGRAGVPMYLVYPAGGGAPELLPEVLTESLVRAAVTKSLQTGQSE